MGKPDWAKTVPLIALCGLHLTASQGLTIRGHVWIGLAAVDARSARQFREGQAMLDRHGHHDQHLPVILQTESSLQIIQADPTLGLEQLEPHIIGGWVDGKEPAHGLDWATVGA